MTPASTGAHPSAASPPPSLSWVLPFLPPPPPPHPAAPELCRTTCSQTPGSGIGLSAAHYQDSQGTPSSAGRDSYPSLELPPPTHSSPSPMPNTRTWATSLSSVHHSHIQLMTKGYDPTSATSRASPFSLPLTLSSLDHFSWLFWPPALSASWTTAVALQTVQI